MDLNLWLITAILGGIIFIGALFFFVLRRKKGDFDYKNFYMAGIGLLPLGVIFIAEDKVFGGAYLLISLILMGIGLKNKDKWRNIELTPEQKKRHKIVLLAGIVVLFLGILVAFYINGSILNILSNKFQR